MRKKWVFVAVGALIVITSPIFIWLFSEMHSAGKALDEFGQRLISRDYDGPYDGASNEFQRAISKQDFVLQQTTLSAKLGPLKQVKRGNSETIFNSNGGYTTVATSFVFENAERNFSFKLKKVGDSWRVFSYEEE